jgi:hypothetical protein
MRGSSKLFIASGTALLSAQVLGHPIGHNQAVRHQLIVCMTKQMSASKAISYNQASKLCKEQMQAPPLASNAVGKPLVGLNR